MSTKPISTTDEEDMYIKNALTLQLQSFRRTRDKQVTGSAMWNAVNAEIEKVHKLIAKFGV